VIFLNRLGMVCALGDSIAEISQRVFDLAQSGVAPVENYLPGRSLALGRVEAALGLPSLDEFSRRDRSRNNQLGLAALYQIRSAVEETIERHGADRFAVVIGTSTSGIAEGETALRAFAKSGSLPEWFHYGQQELGSPAAFYLAAAGVGTLRLVDDDVVDRSNLQRQVLHTDARIGVSKVESAAVTLGALNPRTHLEAMHERVTSANVERILDAVDVVIDGADNFPVRYLLNDACVKLGKPLVYGAVHRFEGQLSVFDAGRHRGDAPCYRCLFPEPPPPEAAPNCSEAGVLGVLPGVIGLLQATEAIKLLLGIGESLAGRLLQFDALAMRFRETRLTTDPDCAICAPGRPFPGYIDYQQFCAGR